MSVSIAFERVVSARVVRRVIRRHRKVGGFGREVPHEHGYALPADELEAEDRAELGAPSHGLVVLVAADADNQRTRFELAIFAAWEELRRRGDLPVSAIRERIHRVGQTELDEVRSVLRAQRRLLPPRPGEARDGVTWSLFAAYWAELRVFDRERLTLELPTLAARHDEIDRLFAADVPWPIPAAPPPDLPAPPPRAVLPSPEAQALAGRLAALIDAEAPWPELLAPVEDRRLLHDLRKACLDAEHPLERGDLVRFVLTLGRRPLVRPLPHLGPVRVVRHLARARARTTDARFGAALDQAIAVHEQRLRARLGPLLRAALTPAVRVASRVEEVALDKTIEELLDRLVAKGRLDFPTLRDGISRNQAKLDELRMRDVIDDPLLAADRTLAGSLDGVHRRGEIYRRVLHRLSALAFGVPLGRVLTRFVVLPVAGAFALLEALHHTVGLLVHLPWMHPAVFVSTALFILGLVNSALVRRVTMVAVRAFGRGLRAVFVSFPRWLFARPFFKSAGWRLIARWLIEPALLASPLSLPVALLLDDLPPAAHLALVLAPFVVALVLVNSALGVRLEEATTDLVVRTRRAITEDLLPGLVTWVLAVFRALLDGFERLLYAVDEQLRFRAGARRRRVVLVAVLAVPWRLLAYVLRLYVNLSLEPKVNPVKHFPAVTIGHKLIVPISIGLQSALEPALGATAASTIAAVVLFVVPGLFGFLAWELKENWRLYGKNRARTLRPVVVGSHGETIERLLVPGFHSGTLPKLFKKLRRSLRRPPGPARERTLAKLAQRRAHLEHDVASFIERDLLPLCTHAGVPLALESVELAANRIRVRLSGGRTLSFEAQSGHIAGSFQPPPSEPALIRAVAGAHRMAGVDLIRETIAASIANAPYDIAERGLIVWPGPGYTTELVLPLKPLETPPILWRDWVAAHPPD